MSSFFRTILSGVPILFNIFINDLFLWLTKSDLHNFADDNTSAVICNNLIDHLHTLEKESESVVDWFTNNKMMVNADKFQAIIMNKKKGESNTHKLKIYNDKIETTKSVKLLHIEIDKQLSFNQHIWKLCSKASMQLNVILMGNNEKITMISSFVYSSFNCCPLVGHFCSCKSSQKIEKI